ncbi:MAG: urease accessory protein UreD [Nakamurella sp.]
MTLIGVAAAQGRARLTLTDGPVGARVLSCTDSGARIGLVAQTALLLGGDHIEIDIDVGPNAWLELIETAGTVVYDAGGVPSSWTVRIRVAEGGTLIWAGEPFVVARGANVRRGTVVDLGAGAVAFLRETLVLGRTGETGGAVSSRMQVTREGRLLLLEDLDLTDHQVRGLPGVVGAARVLDTIALLGRRAPTVPALPAGSRFDLDGEGTLARSLTNGFAGSALSQVRTAWQPEVRAATVSAATTP